MKMLPLVAVVLALGGIGTCIYGFVETKPNVQASERRMLDSSGQSERIQQLENAVWQDYHDTLKMQSYLSLGLGILAAALGGFAAFRKQQVKLAAAGAALGVIVIVMAVALGA